MSFTSKTTNKTFGHYSIIDRFYWEFDGPVLYFEFEKPQDEAKFREAYAVFMKQILDELPEDATDWGANDRALFSKCYWSFRAASRVSNGFFWKEFDHNVLTTLEQKAAHHYNGQFIEEVEQRRQTALNKFAARYGEGEPVIENAVVDNRPENVKQHQKLLEELQDTYEKKNHDYGDSFSKSIDIFGLTAAVVRMSDKWERLISLQENEAQVKDEKIRDTLMDLANYAVMTVMYLDNKEEK